ncbi:ABC transporter permease subunit, partial [Xanthomonas citri pv. citri]
IRVHILRNSMIPVATFLGMDLGALMGGAIVTEGIFNVPGIGNQLYKALTRGRTHGRLRGVRDGHHLLRGQSAG